MRTPLQPGEEVAITVRRHWIALAGPFGAVLFLSGCLLAAWYAGRPYLLAWGAALLAPAALWALWRWLDWRCDIWAVTGQRVIDESGVLAVRMIDSPIERIHNITCEQSILGRLLGYGTLNIQTGAERGSTTIADVASPTEVRQAILTMKERARGGGAAPAAASVTGAAAAADPDSRECPYCAERIKARATVCRFCGRDVRSH